MAGRFGASLELHYGQGRNLELLLFSKITEFWESGIRGYTALHPRSDGMVEWMNRNKGKGQIFVESGFRFQAPAR